MQVFLRVFLRTYACEKCREDVELRNAQAMYQKFVHTRLDFCSYPSISFCFLAVDGVVRRLQRTIVHLLQLYLAMVPRAIRVTIAW